MLKGTANYIQVFDRLLINMISVGYHSDQLTYLGPHAVIGSLSLGVAREFRVRKIVAREAD